MEIVKMHGLGNDFILTALPPDSPAEAARTLCRRRLGIGADGLVIIEKSAIADVKMEIYNADGSRAEMCGNAIRCFAKHVYESGMVRKVEMTVETPAGIMSPRLTVRGGVVTQVRVDMGAPSFEAEAVPVLAGDAMDFEVAGLRAAAVLMGVPHTVVVVDDVRAVDVAVLGEEIGTAEIFPNNTNVNFVQIDKPERLKIRTWERGAGPTLACGTGACAAAVICNKMGMAGERTVVASAVGELTIEIAAGGRVYMTGPAEYVFRGETL